MWKKVQCQEKGLAKKLVGHRWTGPFTVQARKGDTVYTIQLEGKAIDRAIYDGLRSSTREKELLLRE